MLDAAETTTRAEHPRSGIQSVEVAGALIRALLRTGGPTKLSELSRAIGMPSAKVHRYLVSLLRIGLASQDPATGRYDLGPLAMEIGLKGFARFEPLRAAETILHELVAEVGETCALAVWGDDAPTIVRVAQARHDLAGSVGLSHHCPLTWSATGLIFLCFRRRRLDRTGDRARSAPEPSGWPTQGAARSGCTRARHREDNGDRYRRGRGRRR